MLAIVLMVCGMLLFNFFNAVTVEAFKDAVSVDRKAKKCDAVLQKVFASAPKEADGRLQMISIYQGLRRADPALAAELQQYPPALKMNYMFLQLIADDARARLQSRGVSSTATSRVDLDTVV